MDCIHWCKNDSQLLGVDTQRDQGVQKTDQDSCGQKSIDSSIIIGGNVFDEIKKTCRNVDDLH